MFRLLFCIRKEGIIGCNMDLRNMMDNAAGTLRAGALQLSETLGIAVHALEWCIDSLNSISFEAVRLEMF